MGFDAVFVISIFKAGIWFCIGLRKGSSNQITIHGRVSYGMVWLISRRLVQIIHFSQTPESRLALREITDDRTNLGIRLILYLISRSKL